MGIILISFSISIFLLTICIIPFLEYFLSIRPLNFSFWKWNAILLFVGVKLSFINILCNFAKPIDVLLIFLNLFYWQRAFLRVFYQQIVRLLFLRRFLTSLFDCKVRYLYLIHLFKSCLKFQLLSPQLLPDLQHYLEFQWSQGYSFDHIALRNCCFIPVKLLFFQGYLCYCKVFGF